MKTSYMVLMIFSRTCLKSALLFYLVVTAHHVLGQAAGVLESCNSTSVTYRVDRNQTDVVWYDARIGGNVVGTGQTFTTGNLSQRYFWASTQTQGQQLEATLLRFAKPDAAFKVQELNCISTPITFTANGACQGGTFVSRASSGVYSATGTFPMTNTDSLTMQAWVKWDGVITGGASQCIMLNGNSASSGYALYIDGASKNLMILLGGVATLKSNKSLTANQWQHVAIARTSGRWTIYVDGLEYSVSNENATPYKPGSNGGGRFSIGKNNAETDGFTGEIDEVAIWKRAFNLKEVNELRTGLCVTKYGSDGNWNFNETSGTVIRDVSTHGLNLSIVDPNARGVGTAAYQWNFGDGSELVTTNELTVSHEFLSRGRQTVTLTVSDFTNCPNSTSQVISLAARPSGISATASGPASICKGEVFDLIATGIPYISDISFPNRNYTGWTLGSGWGVQTYAQEFIPRTPNGSLAIAPDKIIINSAAQMPSFSTVGLKDVFVFVTHFLNNENESVATIEASANATTWTILSTHNKSYPDEIKFKEERIALPVEFENQPTVYLRFRYNDTNGNTVFNEWHIEKVRVGLAAYLWSSTPQGISSGEQVIKDVCPMETTTYSLLATNGCDNQHSNITVTVKPFPSGTISGGGKVCQYGKPLRVYFKGSGATGPYTFKYAINGSEKTVTTTSGDSVSFAVPTIVAGDFTYHLLAVSTPTSCEQGYNNISTTITVSATPGAVIEGVDIMCQGEGPASVYMRGYPGQPPFTIRYQLPDNQIIEMHDTHDGLDLPVDSSLPKNLVFKVLGVRDALGCENTYAQGSQPVKTVIVKPAAEVRVTQSSHTYCDAPVVLTASGEGNFNWWPGEGLNKNTGAVVEANPKIGTVYKITSDRDGCFATVTAEVGVSKITMTELASASSYLVCPGTAVTLTAPKATATSAPIFSESFDTDPTRRNWTTRNEFITVPYYTDWVFQDDPSNIISYDFQIRLGSGFVMALVNRAKGETVKRMLISPAFSTIGSRKMILTLNDGITMVKTTNSAANVQLSLDGETWVTISSVREGRQTFTTYTRQIEIPAEFENQPRVQIRFESSFENLDGSYKSIMVWWMVNNMVITAQQKLDWTWTQVAGNEASFSYGESLIVNPTKPVHRFIPSAVNYAGCTKVFPFIEVKTQPVPALTLGPLQPIPLNGEYANVPIIGYSGFDQLSVLSSGANTMPGFVTRNYENLTSLPPALPVIVPKVPAGTYDFVMRTTNSTTGCSTDIPFHIVVGNSDSGLTGLTVDVAPPGWDRELITVSAVVKSVIITATVSDPAATLTINGIPAVSGAPAGVQLNSVGRLQIPVTVTAQDQTQSTTMVSIERLSNIDQITRITEAKATYSLRKLSASYLHGIITKPIDVPGFKHADKPLVTVRRSSDNALLDLGYDGTGALDTLTLLRFAGSGDAFVTVWYDQSGNDLDAFQATPASQPRIMHAGVIERKNSAPTVYFYGSASQNVFLNTVPFEGFNDQFSLFAVSGVQENQPSNLNGLASKMSSGYPAPFAISGGSFNTGNGTQDVTSKTLIKPFTSASPFGIWSFHRRSTIVAAEINILPNISDASTTSAYADLGTPLVIGSDEQGQSRLNGWISELVLLNQPGLNLEVGGNQLQAYLKPKIIAFTQSGSTQLIIQGNNFLGATSVTIGGAGVSFQVVNDNKIITTATALTSGIVSITTPIGEGSKGFFYGPPPGNALRFTGGFAHVEIENTLSRPEFTIETWVRTSINSAVGSNPFQGTVLLNAGSGSVVNGFVLSILNNKIAFLDGDGNQSTFGTANVVDGRWHHVAVLRRPGRFVKIYVDGVLDEEGLAGTAALMGNTLIEVGGNPANADLAFRGEMDELRIWQLLLGEEALKDGMLNVLPKPYHPELKNYHTFNVFTGDLTTELYNLSIPDRPGTLRNFNPTGEYWVESYAMVVPKALAATAVTSKGFTAHWAAPAMGSVQSYILEVSKSPAFPKDQDGYLVIPVPLTDSFELPGLEPATIYYYRLSARRSNEDNAGGWSQTMKVTTLATLNLSALTLSEGLLSESFNEDVLIYTSYVGADITDTRVTASILNANAQMQIKINNGTYGDLTSGVGSAALALVGGANIISIRVTAPDYSDAHIYTITVYKDFIPPGNALRFDAIDDYVTLDNNTLGNFGTGDFTIELYLRTTQLSAGSIFNKRDVCNLTSYLDFIVADGKMKFVSCTDASGKDYKSLVGNAWVSDGRWHHVAVTRSGTTITLFVDGKQDVSFTGSGIADISNTVAAKIGKNVCENRFIGSMDELRVWNVARAQQELQTTTGSAAHLLAYYNFDTGVNDLRKYVENLVSYSNSAILGNGGSTRWVESYAMVRPGTEVPSNISTTGFTAKWAAPLIGVATGYVLQASASPTFDSFVEGYSGLTVTGATSQDVIIPAVPNGRTSAVSTYYYRVAASKAGVEGQGTFSETMTANITPLPVTLISFTGERVEHASFLQWEVINEVHFDRYEVERSADARNFERIGIVTARSDQKSGITHYDFTDQSPHFVNLKTRYYRLKMVDSDGSYAYSRIIVIDTDEIVRLGVYPNPTPDAVNLLVDASLLNTRANMYDAGGLLVQTIWITKNDQLVSLKNRASGTYIITFANGSALRFVKL